MRQTAQKNEFDAKAKRPRAEGAPSEVGDTANVVKVIYPLNQHSQRPQ